MKETRKFFDNNKLNKGYSRITNQRPVNTKSNMIEYNNFLPPIDVIEAYEEIYPGVTEKLFYMAEQEQKHKHDAELILLRQQQKLQKLGKLCAVIFIAIVSMTTVILAEHHFVAAAFSASAFLAVVVSLCFYYFKSQIRRLFGSEENNRERRHHNNGPKAYRKGR